MNLSDEIRKQIEKNKGLKLAVGEINNHLSILEELVRKDIMEQVDEAYQTGYDKGYADKTNNDEVCKKLAKDIQDEAYKRGFEDGKAVNDKGCEGCKYAEMGSDTTICAECCNAYHNQWTAKDDKPIIGEVVERYLNGKRDGVGMFLGEDGDYWNCLFWTGAIFGTFAYPSNQFKRTGNVCNIDKILEAMKA